MTKKIISILFCTVMLLAPIPQLTYAASNVSDINVDVGIFNDGSAYITQTWNCNFDEGTEAYFPIENLGDMSISGFRVSDEDGVYKLIEDWDTGDSFNEKSGKCGIIETNNGYELCWGITEYGKKRYAIEYKIDKFVGAYQDFDGFNFQFINSGMGTLPTDVTLKITMQEGALLDESNTGIWAFGFEGMIHFENGHIVAYTESPLSSSTDSVIVMVQLNKGLINPTRIVDKSFEKVKEKALQGSDYDYDEGIDEEEPSSESTEEEMTFSDWILALVIYSVPLVAIIYFVKRNGKRRKLLRRLYKNVDYFRTAPIAGNLEATYFLAEKFGQAVDDENLIGAAFLKLINAGCLEATSEKSIALFGKEKKSFSFRLVHPPAFTGVTTNKLYDLLILASGNDQILQEKELENYCSRKYSEIDNIVNAAKEDGESTLLQIECFDESVEAKPLGLSERGKNLLLNIMGFKKYLLDFSLIGERSIEESIIWQDYLTFATLLGIADLAIEQFEKVYPDATEYTENAHYYYLMANRLTIASYKASVVARSSGQGGVSSMIGGGGFSGGGSGGGVR